MEIDNKYGSKFFSYCEEYEAHLGVTGNQRAIIPDQVAVNQKSYDGLTFPAVQLFTDGKTKKIRVKLVGDDYDLWKSGTGDMVVRRV